MRAAGLKAISTVVSSTAILIQSKHPSKPELVSLIASRIRGVITAQRFVLCTYNIQRRDLPAACRITPGKRAPTVNSLEPASDAVADAGWVAVSAMVKREDVALSMDELTKIGAEDILIMRIDNSRTNN